MGLEAHRRLGAALAGATGGAASLAASEVLARVVGSPSLILSVGREVVDRVPPAVEDAAIGFFGTYDKVALIVGIVTVSVGLGAVLGVAARRRFWVAAAGFALFGALGVAATVSRQEAAPGFTALVGVAAVAIGLFALDRLLPPPAPARGEPAEAGPAGPVVPSAGVDLERRRFLGLLAGTAGAGVLSGGVGRLVTDADLRGTGPADVRLPAAARPLPPPPPGGSPAVDGLSPLMTPNRDFYRIDTALSVPRVDAGSWRLRLTGMVDHVLELSYRELVSMPLVEADVTLSCVSNEVGGDLVGNARWRGVLLRELLERAGVRPGATQVVGRSVDGWTAGFPTAAVLDGRAALVAVGMNGQPLPRRHGFPARLVVPGLYGYVSATKWLSEIELTTLGAFDAYWVPRGWAKEAPVKTASRIDVPRGGQRLQPGRHTVAGVAWAPTRGIAKVEVSIDGGPWVEAALDPTLGPDSWRLWRHEWGATAGEHTITVRATDGTGLVQAAARTPPRPDGATGYHTVRVEVTG